METEWNFSIEDDTLILNEVSPIKENRILKIKKTPIISKEAFVECYNRWIKGEENEQN